jgi:hypothetical protein
MRIIDLHVTSDEALVRLVEGLRPVDLLVDGYLAHVVRGQGAGARREGEHDYQGQVAGTHTQVYLSIGNAHALLT